MMKNLLYFLLLFVFLMACSKEKECETQIEQTKTEITGFDSTRAIKNGADDYGMKKYVMAFLSKGPNRDLDSLKLTELQRAHLDNIIKMANNGKLVLAGPFFDDGDLRGIYIFNVESIEEAENLTNTDPAIIEGSLKMELKEWYGSAALMELNEIHAKIAKINI